MSTKNTTPAKTTNSSALAQGYFRQPDVQGERVVFQSEDDLWEVPLVGGTARRLTNSRSETRSPRISPDGAWIALCAMEEGDHDVYLMPTSGGEMQRLTWLNSVIHVVGWSPDGQDVQFVSVHESIHHRGADAWIYRVSSAGGPVECLPYGPAMTVSYQEPKQKAEGSNRQPTTDNRQPTKSGLVLGRNSLANSRWKRYAGGMVGELWIDAKGSGAFQRILKDLPGNPVRPQWICNRIWFVSDHEGIGNLYSCNPDGSDLQPESFQQEYYVREPASDGRHVVFHVGGDLWRIDVQQPRSPKREQRINIQWATQRSRVQRRFFFGDHYWEDIDLHPDGHGVALTARGKLFGMPLWELAATQLGVRDGVRYRLQRWLPDSRVAVISDAKGQERLEVFAMEPTLEPAARFRLPPGRVQDLVVSPRHPHLVMTTSRMELWWMNANTGRLRRLDHSTVSEIDDPAFSPDGHWLAYSKNLSVELQAIFLIDLGVQKEGKAIRPHSPVQVSDPVRYDFTPSWDPEGHWLYFLSSRTYNPIWDTVQTATTFSRSIKPYLITLQKDTPNPFLELPRPPGIKDEPPPTPAAPDSKPEEPDPQGAKFPKKSAAPPDPPSIPQIPIDLEGIKNRVVEFPVPESLYEQVVGLPNRVLFTEYPIRGAMDEAPDNPNQEEGLLWVWDFEKGERETLAQDVGTLQVSVSGRTLLYTSGTRVRVLEAGVAVPEDGDETPSRRTGWLDLSRVRISINYPQEWAQMFRETWRLQQEFFWTEDMSGVDWQRVFKRYEKLLPRISSRSELSDLIWEMQGELGTSHAYEYGGDYPFSPRYPVGWLGADLEYDSERTAWIFQRIYAGDLWCRNGHSPLAEPGVLVQQGDLLLEVAGMPLDAKTTPGELLVNQAGEQIILTVASQDAPDKRRHLVVRTLASERNTRYREWVQANAKFVSEATSGRVGYLHIPDMAELGIAEFHRGYLAQVGRDGLIIDVRYNAGGMVSPLILEKLMHRHLGYDVPRWGTPESYPYHTLRGHLLALTNQFAGSDGDMFTASFRELGLGPVVGKRTWGGVIGIDSRYQLVDGTTTTQPQYSIWFHHAGWSVENYGVDPDIEVEDSPQSYQEGRDLQLECAVEVMLKRLEDEPITPMRFDQPPRRPLPK